MSNLDEPVLGPTFSQEPVKDEHNPTSIENRIRNLVAAQQYGI
ncbi:MAG: hypothetical protein AB8G05_17725 [Oligoflexales bacterium]